MGTIHCLVGKSGSGKDTLYATLLAWDEALFEPLVPYTTRPMRMGEQNGREYHFVSEEELEAFEQSGRVLEKRQYETVHGRWTYFTLKFDPQAGERLLIATPAMLSALMDEYGREAVCIYYLHLDDKSRLLRSIERESREAEPCYREVCRRYVADEEDFSDFFERFDAIVIDASGTPDETMAHFLHRYQTRRP